MTPLRIGALGAATITEPGLISPARQIDDVVVEGIAARDPARAAQYAADHGIPQTFDSYKALIESPDIDAVYIALPNHLHHRWTLAALEAGKHVLCEKPMASNGDEAAEMAEAADATGLCLAEAVHYRYHPLADRVRHIVGSGQLGALERIEARMLVPIPKVDIRREFALSGGCVMDPGCYPLQMIRFFSGETPNVFDAKVSVDENGLDVEAIVWMKLPSGANAKAEISIDYQGLDTAVEIYGSLGTLTVKSPVMPHIRNELILETNGERKSEVVQGDPTFLTQLRAFAHWTQGGEKMPTDGAEGVLNMRLIDSVYEKAGLPRRGT